MPTHDQYRLIFEGKYPYLIIPALLIAALATWWVYRKAQPLGNTLRIALAATRMSWLGLLLILLFLSPALQIYRNTILPPSLQILVDNSQSVILALGKKQTDSVAIKIRDLSKRLSDIGYQVKTTSLDGKNINPDSLTFLLKRTNLSSALRQADKQVGTNNLKTVVLISDGIYNLGSNPEYESRPFAIYSVLVGDTITKTDIAIKDVKANRTAYMGNRFPIKIQISQKGYTGKQVLVTLTENGTQVNTQQVELSSDWREIEFLIEAKQEGRYVYEFAIEPQSGEFTVLNNKSSISVEVVERKQLIWVLASAPHPDVRAVIAALANKDNRDVKTFVYSVNQVLPTGIRPDLVILVNLPNNNFGSVWYNQVITEWKTPHIFIASATAIGSLPETVGFVGFAPNNGRTDEVNAILNPDYVGFSLPDRTSEVLLNLPPLLTRFASYNLKPQTSVVLWQSLGNINTNKPLLAVSPPTQDVKCIALLAEGLWRWRLLEFKKYQNNEICDAIIEKSAQYLLTDAKRKRFVAEAESPEFEQGRQPIIDFELYDKTFEKVFNQPIEVNILGENGAKLNFTHVYDQGNEQLLLPELEPGLYKYQATAKPENEIFVEKGTFAVKRTEAEAANLTADYGLLARLSKAHRATAFAQFNPKAIADTLAKQMPAATIQSVEEFKRWPLFWWILILIVALASAEWVIRRYYGVS